MSNFGKVTLNDFLDYELLASQRHTFEVITFDHDNNDSDTCLSDRTTVNVNVPDDNDAPYFSGPMERILLETNTTYFWNTA